MADNTQVELLGKSELQQVETSEYLPSSPIAQVMELAKDKDFDPAKFETLVKFFREERVWDAKKAYNDALASFQAECPNVKRMTQGHGYKYAAYEDLLDLIKPYMEKYGISIRYSFPLSSNPDTLTRVIGYLSIGAHTETSEFEVPKHRLPQKMVPDINDARNTGATLSYAKRYCLINALNIVTEGEDKDGVTSSGTISESEQNTIYALLGDYKDEAGVVFNTDGWFDHLGLGRNTLIKDIPKPLFKVASGALRAKLNKVREDKRS